MAMNRRSRKIPIQHGSWWHRVAMHWRALVAAVLGLLTVAGAGWTVHAYAGRFVTVADLVAHAEACNATGKDTAVWERRLTERTERLAADIETNEKLGVERMTAVNARIEQINDIQLQILDAVTGAQRRTR